MTTPVFSAPLEALLTSPVVAHGPVLFDILPHVGEALRADRCFLYLRNPRSAMGKIAFCWCRNRSVPDVTEPAWKTDPSIANEDPLFAAALRADPSVFVEDVETADPATVNRAFEARTFGHRALIHAHLVHEGELWGILQPCVFGQPRRWSTSERQWIEALLPRLLPRAIAFVRETGV